MERIYTRLAVLVLVGLAGCGQSEPASQATNTPEVSPGDSPGSEDHEEFNSLLELATAAAREGRIDLAAQSFDQAIQESRTLGNARLQAQVHSAYALFFNQVDRVESAQEQLQLAVAASRETGDPQLLAHCQLELGIFCQHQHQFVAAKELLTAAAAALDPKGSDGQMAQGHLTAIETRQACACGAQGRALVQALREQIISEAPPNLVSDVVVDFTPEAGFQVECDTSRKPTAGEAAQLMRIVSQARAAYLERVRPTALR